MVMDQPSQISNIEKRKKEEIEKKNLWMGLAPQDHIGKPNRKHGVELETVSSAIL
jgi:hypothetical protein